LFALGIAEASPLNFSAKIKFAASAPKRERRDSFDAMAPEANDYIIDDDEGVRDSIAALLDGTGVRTRSFASGLEFLDLASSLEPGCLISDVKMPELDGIALLKRLKERQLDFSAILITAHGDVRTAVEAIRSGAAEFLEKPFTAESLLEAVERVQKARHSTSQTQQSALNKLAVLTAREREVLERLVEGMPNKIIAYDLALSTRTVEFYRTRIMTKLQVQSLSELIRLALAAGITLKRTH
jgi:two-component system response regulator FixJ